MVRHLSKLRTVCLEGLISRGLVGGLVLVDAHERGQRIGPAVFVVAGEAAGEGEGGLRVGLVRQVASQPLEERKVEGKFLTDKPIVAAI